MVAKARTNEDAMKTFVFAASFALLIASGIPAQTPTKASAKSASAGGPSTASNEDLNIRAYIELLRTDIKKSKSQIMGDVMQLDTDQSTKFWPIYKEFETEFSTLGEQVVALVKNYADHYDAMTDDIADQLATKVLSIEDQRNELKKKYYGRFKEALGGITATRFLQVENQLERLVDLQIASQLPVISQQ
jgi:hypothetical protein